MSVVLWVVFLVIRGILAAPAAVPFEVVVQGSDGSPLGGANACIGNVFDNSTYAYATADDDGVALFDVDPSASTFKVWASTDGHVGTYRYLVVGNENNVVRLQQGDPGEGPVCDYPLAILGFQVGTSDAPTARSDVELHWASSSVAGAPLEYRVAEDPSFTGAAWLDAPAPTDDLFPTYAVPYTLTASGDRTVHLQLRLKADPDNRSFVARDDIRNLEQRILRSTLAITAFTIDGGAATTEEREVTLGWTTSAAGGGALQYRVSESPDFANAGWQAVPAGDPSVPFTLSPGSADHTVFLQIRAASNGEIAAPRSADIRLLERYAINAADAFLFALPRGWVFEASEESFFGTCRIDLASDGFSLFIAPSLGTARCAFDLFENRELNAGWTFASIDVMPFGCFDVSVDEPGASESAAVRVTAAARAPVARSTSLANHCFVAVNALELLGPAATDWREAFR